MCDRLATTLNACRPDLWQLSGGPLKGDAVQKAIAAILTWGGTQLNPKTETGSGTVTSEDDPDWSADQTVFVDNECADAMREMCRMCWVFENDKKMGVEKIKQRDRDANQVREDALSHSAKRPRIHKVTPGFAAGFESPGARNMSPISGGIDPELVNKLLGSLTEQLEAGRPEPVNDANHLAEVHEKKIAAQAQLKSAEAQLKSAQAVENLAQAFASTQANTQAFMLTMQAQQQEFMKQMMREFRNNK